jgi:dihydrofolate synthase/folylpolyglutamate synthase
MPDFATSSHPGVSAQLARLSLLSPGADILGLERIGALLDRVGNPHRRLPPIFHVAGTNGKGSTCAYLRAAVEAAGMSAHVFTSPHLVRFNERIRIAGQLIEDDLLADLLAEVLDAGGDIGASFFEVTTAVAFLAFARTPADACIVEVGLGGRLDATNIIADPAICGVAQIALDHQSFLGDSVEGIGGEKAGIAKPGVPIVTLHYPAGIANRVGQVVHEAGASWLVKGDAWDAAAYRDKLHYRDARGKLALPLPRLPGAHQAINAGLAIAMLRHQQRIAIPDSAIRAAMGWADWPARLQRLHEGALFATLPAGSELWLDGAHNPASARALADFFRNRQPAGRPLHIVLGLLANKDAEGIVGALAGLPARIHAVPVPGHAHHAPEEIVRIAAGAGLKGSVAADPAAALAAIAARDDGPVPPTVLAAGSLYLAGAFLAANGTLPN